MTNSFPSDKWTAVAAVFLVLLMFFIFTNKHNPFVRNNGNNENYNFYNEIGKTAPLHLGTDTVVARSTTINSEKPSPNNRTWVSESPIHHTPENSKKITDEDVTEDFDYNLRIKNEIDNLTKLAVGDSIPGIKKHLDFWEDNTDFAKPTEKEIRQIITHTIKVEVEEVTRFDRFPIFKNGDLGKFKTYIQSSLQENPDTISIKATVVNFRVNARGYVDSAYVINSKSKMCDSIICAKILDSPRWKPALQNKKPVAIELSIPVYFEMDTTGLEK